MNKKMKAKGRAILKAKSTISPPHFNIMDYKLSMVRALNYYNFEVDIKEKKKFALEYWKRQGKDVSKIKELSDAWFNTVGAVAHMIMAEVPLNEHDIIRLDNAYDQLVAKIEFDLANKEGEPEVKVAKEEVKTIQDHIAAAASTHIAEIEAAIDDICLGKDPFDAKTYLTKNQVKAPVAKKVGEWFKTKLAELKSVIDDKEMMEGYANLGKRGLNKLIAFVESVVQACDTVAVIAKTLRAPRARKEKPASVLVAKMKYLKEFVELSLKSVMPDKIIGADMIVLYDTEKRRLVKYEAMDGYTLSVRGTTLLNFNPEKSGSKICRKPEVQLKGVSTMTKRPINNLYNEIKSIAGKVTGRINDKMIIVGVFQ